MSVKKKTLFNLLYMLCQGFFWMALCFVYGYAQVFLESRGFDTTQAGFVMGAGCVAGILLQPLAARLSESVAFLTVRTTILLISGLILLLAVPILGGAAGLLLSLCFIALLALSHLIDPFLTALAYRTETDGKPVNYSAARGIGSLAYAISSLLLSRILDLSVNGMLHYFLLSFSLFLLTVLLLPDTRPEPSASLAGDHFFRENRKFCFVVVATALICIHHTIINSFMWSLVNEIPGAQSSLLGTATSVGAIAEVPMMLCFSRVQQKISSDKLLKVAAVFYFLKPLLIVVSPSVPALLLSQGLQIFGYALFTPAMAQYVRQVVPDRHLVLGQTLISLAIGFSGAVSSLFGGALIEQFGFVTTLGFALVLDAAGILILFKNLIPVPKEG